MKECLNCHINYISSKNNSKFCSKDCRIFYYKKKYICKHCKKEYVLTFSHMSKYYCKDCKNIRYKLKCACGCGNDYDINIYFYDRGDKFLKGHGRKNKKNTLKHNLAISKANKKDKVYIYKLCECGCGELTTNKRFIHGHNSCTENSLKGVETKRKNGTLFCSEQTKLKISKANSGENNGMYNKHHTEDSLEKISNASKLNWKDPIFIEKRKKWLKSEEGQQCLRLAALKGSETKKLTKNKFYNTKPELKTEEILKKLNINYIKHYSIYNIKHIYSADFYLIDFNCILEVDGTYWHNYPFGTDKDKIRNKELKDARYNIIRIWENQTNEEIIKAKINNLYFNCFNRFNTNSLMNYEKKYYINI